MSECAEPVPPTAVRPGFPWRQLVRSRGFHLGLGVVALAALLVAGLTPAGASEAFVARFGAAGTAALVVAQALVAVSPFPSQLVAVPLALLHGFTVGVVLLWCGWMLAAVLQYALARRTAADIDLAAWVGRAPGWMRRFPPDHPAFLILARHLPIGPHLVNIVAGALGVPWRRHLGCAAVSIVPEAVFVAGIAVGLFGAP